ncbi:UPF0593 mitochondrial protein [Escovopsis weberi]|uniref:UPF0593 mitochondrial protein n=1 Tax=Escovopsis weberi TaxID=150374 RepID=A0A0M8N7D0_ESCWE|nr:UPF0593 mitochondrial protein [Escovopsis weberi]
MEPLSVTTAYRHLYRGLLRAVQYSSPARYVARDQLRAAFREPGGTLDAEGVRRTVWFLKAAGKEKGLEHRMLRNLLEVSRRRGQRGAWRKVLNESRQKPNVMTEQQDIAWEHYDMTVAMLNKTMGLCLR